MKKLLRNLLKSKDNLPGFSLTELLVVLIIIGILVLLALPNLMPLISRTKATEAELQLGHIYTLEKSYFYVHSKYSTSLEDIGFEQDKLTTEGENGRANYRIEIIQATNNTFVARATAVADFNGDGKFNVWEIDQDKNLKETVKD